ncbi:gltX2 [Acrasis kona]|uniref:GltX2 n=1 Tax=Acrasis kona TaxID=1008807 RepID=A0AAW2Z661_9EUKA
MNDFYSIIIRLSMGEKLILFAAGVLTSSYLIKHLKEQRQKKLDNAKSMNRAEHLKQAYLQLGGDEGIKNMLKNNLSEDQVLNEIEKRADEISNVKNFE